MIGYIQRLVVPLFGLAAAFALFACGAPEPGPPATRELKQQVQKLEQEVKELRLRLQAALNDNQTYVEELQEFVRSTGRSLAVHNNCGERITTLAIWYTSIGGKETPWVRSGVPFESGRTIILVHGSDRRRVLATENSFAIFGGTGPLEEGAKSLNGASDTEGRLYREQQIPVRITLAEEEGMTKYVIPLCG